MKKIKLTEPVQKKTLFGTKTVMKEKIIKVDNKTYKAMKKAQQQKEDEEFEKLLLLGEVIFDD